MSLPPPTPGSGWPPLQQPTQRSGWPTWAWLLVAAGIIAAVIGIAAANSSSDDDAQGEEAGCSRVVYQITGSSSRVSVTMSNAQGNTEQLADQRVPFMRSFPCWDDEFMYISAQNQGESGSVHCTITVDGVKVGDAVSQGAFVIATCSA